MTDLNSKPVRIAKSKTAERRRIRDLERWIGSAQVRKDGLTQSTIDFAKRIRLQLRGEYGLPLLTRLIALKKSRGAK